VTVLHKSSNVEAGRKVAVESLIKFEVNDFVKVINTTRPNTYGFLGTVCDIDEEAGMIAVYLPALGISPWFWSSEIRHVVNQYS
jgi:hypothetical protein